MTKTPEILGYEQYLPMSDPFNEQPPNKEGLYPARIHSENGRLAYYTSPSDRRIAVKSDHYRLEIIQRMNAPWYKKLWRSIKPEF